MHNKLKAARFNTPFKITFVYVFIGCIWVLLSDRLMDTLNMSAAITIHT